ncbi:MAG TPA: hypothetical protein VJ783_17685 [Pirellulales bacterium]|nr:hypothetical protein [Pirellulales bacterium]
MIQLPESEPATKPAHRYRSWRLYALVLLPLIALTFGWFAYQVSSRNDFRLFPVCAALAPLLLPTIPLALGLRAFPFDYGPFGKFSRSPPPAETPVTVFRGCTVYLGAGMRNQGTVVVYPSGLALKLYLTGKVFLPMTAIDSVESTRWSGTAVHHHCPEVRTPVTLPLYVGRAVEELAGVPHPPPL